MKHAEQPRKGVSIRDIAASVRLSKSTVSLALRGDSRITEATRARVLRASQKLGYRADPLVGVWLSQMRRGGTRAFKSTLAMIDCFQVSGEWRRYHSMRSISAGAEARARDLGFGWEHHWLNEPGRTPSRLRDMLLARGIKGLLLMGDGDAVPFPLDEFAVANVKTLETHHPAAAADSVRLGYHLRKGLVGLGYQRIGYVHCDYKPEVTRAMTLWPYRLRPLDPADVHTDTLTIHESGPFRFLEELRPLFWPWFKRFRPQVIAGSEPKLLEWLKAEGLSVPDDVGFALIDRDPDDPQMAGVNALHRQHGAAAVDLVAGQLQRGERGLREHPKRVFLEPEWVNGPSAPGPGRRVLKTPRPLPCPRAKRPC